jgi:hypothetical protein
VEDARVNKLIPLVLLAPLGLGNAMSAQAQAPPDPGAAANPGTTNPSKSDPSRATPGVVSPSSAQSDQMSPADHSTRRTDPDQSALPPTRVAEAATQGNKDKLSAGTIVQSPAGQAIGTIKDIVPDPRSGQPSYVLVATRSGAKTAIPYSTIAPLFINGRVTLDRWRLEDAPHVSYSQLRDQSDKAWQQKAQQYWNASDRR